jgi:hypothetical protein
MWTLSNGDLQWPVPAEYVKMSGGQPFLLVVSTNHKLIRLITAGQLHDVPKNSSLAGNKGLQKLIDLRNVASGFRMGTCAKSLMAEEDDEDEEKPTKKAKWTWASGCHQQPGEHDDDPEVVSFKVPGHAGMVTAFKAYHAKQQLLVSMDDAVLRIVFSLIIGSGLDLAPTKKKET